VRLPALIFYVAVLNEGISREQKLAHLWLLPGHADLTLKRIQGNFLCMRCDHYTVQLERHTEFTRYAIVQTLPAHAGWGEVLPELAAHVAPGTDWLRGLPVTKNMSAMLSAAESLLADLTGSLERKGETDQALLDSLVALAASIERATVEHGFRFSATRAYDTLVSQRLVELRERPIAGTQTLGEFMQRRLSPAMATVQATEKRLASLAERVSRTSALLRTRVDIATKAQTRCCSKN
jgi:uncharacterized membrane-anchored protein